MANLDTMRYRWGPRVEMFMKKTGTVVIQMGDLVQYKTTNGRIMACTGPTNCTALVGVADSASPAADPTATVVKVLAPGFGTVFEYKLATASVAFKFGQGFTIKTADAQTLKSYKTHAMDPVLTASSVVARCAQEMAASGSVVKVYLLPSKVFSTRIMTGRSYTSSRQI
jgi:hypothetical protein